MVRAGGNLHAIDPAHQTADHHPILLSYLDVVVQGVVCGPGSMAQGHKPDEFIELSELALCDAMLDRLVTALADPG